MFRDRATLIVIRLEEYNYPAATAIKAIMVLLDSRCSWSSIWCSRGAANAMADVTIVLPIGSDTAGQRAAGRRATC
ncbi:hypothetical protein BQ8482_111841 [Mesorhizobium delmotii]|uniref:Uncharacterized protein n=1 Tax=Mesorhizobium delmotii TaxID=1631247 RepID=A0A2P9AFJ5_9HYPH|nr:hypothetical protein BQ8482_111841 [Mesorhizobium delmotii]